MTRATGPIALALLLALAGPLGAAPAPPGDARAYDTPDDQGGSITVEWRLSPDDAGTRLAGYEVHRAAGDTGRFQPVGQVPRGNTAYNDGEAADGIDYRYRVAAVDADGAASAPAEAGPARAREQWFKAGKANVLVATALFVAMVLVFLERARRGRLFIRRLAGLDAVEEAVGRATEMGRPILYCLGIGLLDYISTLAALNILGQVARKTAEYGTPLVVPTCEPIVHTVAREVVKESYAAKGRPDLFSDDMVYFVTSDQMGYAAALSGIMARERPATNLFMGYYAAEALVLAESGAATGAIQIAGTDQITQLPFFITACDFTLMGEELYAASAYLSQEPLLVGTIKAQDFGKVLIILLVAVGSLAALAFRSDVFSGWFGIK